MTTIVIRFVRRGTDSENQRYSEMSSVERSQKINRENDRLENSDRYIEYLDRLNQICDKHSYKISFITPVWMILYK